MPSGPEGPTPIWGQRMVGQGRLELPTSRLSSARSNQLSYWPVSRIRLASSRGVPGNGGGGRVRTDDLRLAKPPLSQLSYAPIFRPATRSPGPWTPTRPPPPSSAARARERERVRAGGPQLGRTSRRER